MSFWCSIRSSSNPLKCNSEEASYVKNQSNLQVFCQNTFMLLLRNVRYRNNKGRGRLFCKFQVFELGEEATLDRNPSRLAEHHKETLRSKQSQNEQVSQSQHVQIGRASCRERVQISVVAVSLQKKKEQTTLSPLTHDTSTPHKSNFLYMNF